MRNRQRVNVIKIFLLNIIISSNIYARHEHSRVNWDAEDRNNNEARLKKAALIDLPRAKGWHKWRAITRRSEFIAITQQFHGISSVFFSRNFAANHQQRRTGITPFSKFSLSRRALPPCSALNSEGTLIRNGNRRNYLAVATNIRRNKSGKLFRTRSASSRARIGIV